MTDARADLDVEIIALLVAGLSERDVCLRLGCTMGRVRAALDESAARTFAPGYVGRMRADSLESLDALNGGVGGQSEGWRPGEQDCADANPTPAGEAAQTA